MTQLRLRVRQHGRLAILCGIDVESIEQSATVSRVPGCPFGMALVRGQIIPVLRVGDGDGCLVVGRVRGEVFGIMGLDIDSFGSDESVAQGPTVASDTALDVDVDALIARAKLQRHSSQPSEETS